MLVQYDIGWRHFMRGRISIEWGNIMQHHLEVNQIKNMSAEKWGTGLLFINWKHILHIWRERLWVSTALHGVSTN
jgi:hypothetical protein